MAWPAKMRKTTKTTKERRRRRRSPQAVPWCNKILLEEEPFEKKP